MTAEFRDYPALDFRPVDLINIELGNTLWRDIRYVDPHPLRDRRRPAGLMVPSLMGAVLSHVRPEQAGAAAGVLTTTQQFASASGVAVIGAVFYEVIGGALTRASFVSWLAVVVWIDAALLIVAALLTFLLPRRTVA
jgi:hypothetical protein